MCIRDSDRAVKYLDNENFPKALKALKTYTKSQPNDADGWNLYGYTSRKMGKFDKAKVYYDKALEIDPNHDILIHQNEKIAKVIQENIHFLENAGNVLES